MARRVKSSFFYVFFLSTILQSFSGAPHVSVLPGFAFLRQRHTLQTYSSHSLALQTLLSQISRPDCASDMADNILHAPTPKKCEFYLICRSKHGIWHQADPNYTLGFAKQTWDI